MFDSGKKLRLASVVLAGALTVSSCAFAQSTVTIGELLDRGGRKLTKEEAESLLRGATRSGIQRGRPQTKFQVTLRPDGSVSGSAIDFETQSNYTNVTGKWTINDKGQYCGDLRNSWGRAPTGSGVCFYLFKLGENYYEAPTDEREEQALERTITRK